MERKWSRLISRFYVVISLEKQRKTAKVLSQGIQHSCRDSNWISPENKSGLLLMCQPGLEG